MCFGAGILAPNRFFLGGMAEEKPPGKRPRPAVNLDNVAVEWDSAESIRERLRNALLLLDDQCQGQWDIKSTVANKDVLFPLLRRMATAGGVACGTLPVDPLRRELRAAYMKNKIEPDGAQLQGDSWSLRKFTGFIKTKTSRKEVSKEPSLNESFFVTYVFCPSLHYYWDGLPS